jgi:hypothetical protein
MADNVTPIRKYAKVSHGMVLDLYKVGTEEVLNTIEKMDSRRAAVVGGSIGVLVTVAVVLVGSWIKALF